MKKRLTGPYAVLMTPFQGESVNMDAYREQVVRLNESAISGYVTNGSTGEFVQLSLEEQMAITQLVAQTKTPEKSLVVSACTGNVADTVRLCKHAATVGADAVLVCPPYYFQYTPAEREEYFIQVADLSPVPVFLYNIPFFTQPLELDTIYRLLEHKNIIGIKDSSGSMKRLEHLIQVTDGKDVSIFTGTDDMLLPALVGGCVGSMTAFASIYPEEICGIYEGVKTGDLQKARSHQFAIMPDLRKADAETFPKGYKKLMQQVSGIPFPDKEALR